MVYSPVDAVQLAKENPDKQVVFLGVGFETTAPGTAAAALTAGGAESGKFLSLVDAQDRGARAARAHGDAGFQYRRFYLSGSRGHDNRREGLSFLPEEYSMPAVIAGFEPEDILRAVYRLAKQIAEKSPKIENEYRRAVTETATPLRRT